MSTDKPKRRTKDWKKFVEIETPSIRKSKKRSEMGLCIGCGKNPCVCKNPGKKESLVASSFRFPR